MSQSIQPNVTNDDINSAFFVISILQFVLPGILTFIVVSLKLLGFIFCPNCVDLDSSASNGKRLGWVGSKFTHLVNKIV